MFSTEHARCSSSKGKKRERERQRKKSLFFLLPSMVRYVRTFAVNRIGIGSRARNPLPRQPLFDDKIPVTTCSALHCVCQVVTAPNWTTYVKFSLSTRKIPAAAPVYYLASKSVDCWCCSLFPRFSFLVSTIIAVLVGCYFSSFSLCSRSVSLACDVLASSNVLVFAAALAFASFLVFAPVLVFAAVPAGDTLLCP